MLATLLEAVRTVALREVPDPVLHHPTDVVVRVTATCICGSDLHPYRGTTPAAFPKRAGHEFIGVVTDAGDAVTTLSPGDTVIAPFAISDGTCTFCRAGLPTSCRHGSFWGFPDSTGVLADGGQGELVRVPLADGTLVATGSPVPGVTDADLLALSDVMGTGHHAAVSADVSAGDTVVVVGDGAVGLCAVAAAVRLGAARVIALSRHPARQALATAVGATDIVAERGTDATAHVRELLGPDGADAACDCVGSAESMGTAAAVVRPGGRLGCVGMPAGGAPLEVLFRKNVALAGGVAPVRAYLPELLVDVRAGRLRPGRVFDAELPLTSVADGYMAMDTRTATKVLLYP